MYNQTHELASFHLLTGKSAMVVSTPTLDFSSSEINSEIKEKLKSLLYIC